MARIDRAAVRRSKWRPQTNMVRPELAGGRADRGGGSSSEIEGEGNARPRRGAKTRGPLAADACAHRRGEFLALNADVQHLSSSLSPTRLQIGSDGEFPASHTDVSVFHSSSTFLRHVFGLFGCRKASRRQGTSRRSTSAALLSPAAAVVLLMQIK